MMNWLATLPLHTCMPTDAATVRNRMYLKVGLLVLYLITCIHTLKFPPVRPLARPAKNIRLGSASDLIARTKPNEMR